MILPAVQGNACNTAAAGAEPARMQGGRCACSGLSMRTYDGGARCEQRPPHHGHGIRIRSSALRCVAPWRWWSSSSRKSKQDPHRVRLPRSIRLAWRNQSASEKNKAVLLESSTSSCLFGFLQGRNATQDQCFLRSSSKNEKPQALSRHARSCTGCAMN